MRIERFITDYVRLAKDPVTQSELKELELEYNRTIKSGTPIYHVLLRHYVEKARKIAKPSVVNKSAYEETVWRHNREIDLLDPAITPKLS